ncbi:microtubule organization protein AKNA [Rhinophrynus dorsalis]
MNSDEQKEHNENSADEEDTFTNYMDENGIIGMEEEEEVLEMDNQGVPEQEEEGYLELQEERILGLDEDVIFGLGEQAESYPDPPSDEEPSGMESWTEQFDFSQMTDGRNSELFDIEADSITERHETDCDISEDHPGVTVSLPPPTDWRPPSRDQQLDMTEDEQDHRSSIERWDDDEEEENFSQGHSDLPYDNSPSPDRFEEYSQTLMGEEQWRRPTMSSLNEDYAHEEDEPSIPFHSPSQQPSPTNWGPKILSRLGGLNISPRIEDETLPESSCTDSADGPAASAPSNLQKTAITQTKEKKSEPSRSSSTPTRTPNSRHSSKKSSKPSAALHYGRGQLNYPLPDFSKVGPRVRYDQSYRPPQPRRLDSQPQGLPVIFKSPAEIVREVLMSSTEKLTEEPAAPPTVPQEFQTPQQATELVHQLQEDYHKLLTKYAEAENTIDRLRLGAKVSLYSDPPKPSHSVQMGTIQQGSKIMEFTIPQVQKATFISVNEVDSVLEEGSGSPAPINHSVTHTDLPLPVTTTSSALDGPEDITSTLTDHVNALNREVDLLEALLHSGNLTPAEQRQAVWELRGSLDLLERRYLRAREQNRQAEHHTGTWQTPEEMDPHRVLEGAIFQLGVHLDEIKDRVEDSAQLDLNTKDTSDAHASPPVPSIAAPIPALITPYPEVTQPTESPGPTKADVDSLSQEEADSAEALPQPLRHKQMQVEKEYDTLLSTYDSFKTLPGTLALQKDEWPQAHPENVTSEIHPQDVRPENHFQYVKPQKYQQHTKSQNHLPDGKTQKYSKDARTKDYPHESRPQDYPHEARPQDYPHEARPQDYPQDARPQDYLQDSRPQDYLQDSRPHDQLQVSRHTDHAQTSRLQGHKWTGGAQDPLQPSRLQDHQKTAGTPDGATPGHSPSRTEQRRVSHEWGHRKPSPEVGGHLGNTSVHQTKAASPRVSLSSSPSHQLREETPRSQAPELSVGGESIRGSHSRRSSVSSKSVSSSAQRDVSRHKRTSVQLQDRIVSPETDSGFLGSESGRSPLLQKQRNGLGHSRDVPNEILMSSSSSPSKRDFGQSKTESDRIPRTQRAIWGKRQQGDQLTGPSLASSPSPGPKSLTESESRDQSQTSGSDSERDGCSDVMISDPSFGASLRLSPIRKLPQPHGNILETRTARDHAIHELQKEVVQLRQHLENSLNRSSPRGKQAEAHSTATFQEPLEERVSNFVPGRVPPFSNTGVTGEDSRSVPLRSNLKAQDNGPDLFSSWTGKGVRGSYTGTSYSPPEASRLPRTEQVSVPHCERCQDIRRRSPESVIDDTRLPMHPSCPLCHVSSDSADTQRSGMSKRHINRRGRRPPVPPYCGQWFMSHPQPLSYIQTPFISYSPPVMYGSSPNLYLPTGYTVTEVRSPRAVTPPPAPSLLQLEDLSWPLNRALEAAKELKVTSKRMCWSLTSDLGLQRYLRGSCLF